MAVKGRRVNAGTSPANLATPATDNVAGSSILVTNRHASASVDLGDEDVTAGAGYELKAGESVTVDLDSEGVYAVASSGSVRVDVLEQGI